MSGAASPLRLLSASAFSAVISIRRYIVDHGVDAETAISALKSISSNFASSNCKLGLALHDRLPLELTFENVTADMQASIALLIELERPLWRHVFPAGRGHVSRALSDDERQAFSDAGLFCVPPTADVMGWWYRIEADVRAEQDAQLSDQGGGAELLTLGYEQKRLTALGLSLEPELVGFENHSLGYDVKSFDLGPVEPVTRLIEVKSSISNPPRMIIPRGEWEKALQFGSAYFFYLWWGTPFQLTILTAKEVAAHMPSDHGDGEWQKVEVIFDPGTLAIASQA